MKKEDLFISTIASDDIEVAKKYGLGLEIAEFCTAYNMDEPNFDYYNKLVLNKINSVKRLTFHLPFNELCPAAIDPKIKEISLERYIQGIKLAYSYNIKKIVIHSGFIPLVYFKEYFIEQSIIFFKHLMNLIPKDVTLVLENVMEKDYDITLNIVKGVNNPNFRLCIDLGHANCAGVDKSIMEWLINCKDYISHYHIHNNYGFKDEHNSLDKGTINYKEVFEFANKYTKNATFTIENSTCLDSVLYLINNKFLED